MLRTTPDLNVSGSRQACPSNSQEYHSKRDSTISLYYNSFD